MIVKTVNSNIKVWDIHLNDIFKYITDISYVGFLFLAFSDYVRVSMSHWPITDYFSIISMHVLLNVTSCTI